MDLQGPRVRVGEFGAHSVVLKKGRKFTLTSRKISGTDEIVSVTYSGLPRDVKVGDPIYLNDGLIRLIVTRVAGPDIFTKVIEGGNISDHKGINLPATTLSTPSVTRKDLSDLKFGISAGVDYVGLSFVRSPDDVNFIKREIRKAGGNAPVIAKIEKFEALGCLDEIIEAADGVMVARGDLGVEIPLEDVPSHQKRIIALCAQHRKPVITATQMLESMIEHPRPTRAEVSDVANAILDGTDAVMLSAETSIGQFPVQAVRTMANIAEQTEKMVGEGCLSLSVGDKSISLSESVAQAACFLAERVEARVIIAFTVSGFTGRLISKFRPGRAVLGVTPHESVCRRMSLFWGVVPVRGRQMKSVDEMISHSVEQAKKMGFLKKGDRAVITAGVPLAVSGATNLIKVHTV
jgi:pyruvate kinase